MAISLLQTNVTAQTTATATSISPSIATVTAGSLVVMIVCVSTNSTDPVPSITDSASQTWVVGGSSSAVFYSASNGGIYLFYFPNSVAITTVTVHSSPTSAIACSFFEVAGIATTSPADISAGAGVGLGNQPSITVTGATTNQANEIAIGAFGVGLSVATASLNTAPTSNWTGLGTGTNLPKGIGTTYDASMAAYYDIMSAEAALTLSGTANQNFRLAVVFQTFKAAAGGYTVTFNNNGGTGSLTAETDSSPTALSLFSTGTMALAAFHFVGWNTVANGTGTAYADGSTYAFSASATLYAQWAPDAGIIPVLM